jgi:hypothetical protein
MIRIGFTGTRNGMTDAQKSVVTDILTKAFNRDFELPSVVGHHGDCVGADADFHKICRELGFFTHIHPPSDASMRAFCRGNNAEPPLPYMRRNREIVRAADYMLATPALLAFVPRGTGGTWRTIEMVVKMRKPLQIVLPHGKIEGAWAL